LYGLNQEEEKEQQQQELKRRFIHNRNCLGGPPSSLAHQDRYSLLATAESQACIRNSTTRKKNFEDPNHTLGPPPGWGGFTN